MSKIGEIYRRNIYGVMGTLIFHILLVGTFLLAEVDMKGDVPPNEVIIEFPEILPEEEQPEPEPEEQEQQEDNIEAEQPDVATRNQTSNRASNRLAQKNEFFDEDYQRELEAAQKLVSDVNKQLQKEAVDFDDIKMPVQTTEGMNPDSIKNVVFTGESNIIYYLENRYHVSLPVPVYLSQGGGQVVVDIIVNREGRVIEAEPRSNNSVRDEQIFLYAKAAASRTIFNADPNAPARQKGSIHYTFIAQ